MSSGPPGPPLLPPGPAPLPPQLPASAGLAPLPVGVGFASPMLHCRAMVPAPGTPFGGGGGWRSPGSTATPTPSMSPPQSSNFSVASPFASPGHSPPALGSGPAVGSAAVPSGPPGGVALHQVRAVGSTSPTAQSPTPVRMRRRSAWGEGEDARAKELQEICGRIDVDRSGSISKLELIDSVCRDPRVAALVVPGLDGSLLMTDERSFDVVDSLFDTIANGKQRIKCADFVAHFLKAGRGAVTGTEEAQPIYNMIDSNRSGSVSKLELVAAVMRNPVVGGLILPGVDSHSVMTDEDTFDRVSGIFEAIAGGKQRIHLSDFEEYYRKAPAASRPRPRPPIDRTATRVFIIGPGFGRELNPRQGALIHQAGFQVRWCHSCPNPEQPNFPVHPYLDQIRAEMDAFQPDVVAAASKGGVYVVGLWQTGYWRGPTLLINAHPACRRLPEGVPIVVAQGSNDEVYGPARADLEQLISTGSENSVFLYYTANSGYLPSGQLTRVGDRHNMESLLLHDCLPRLIDATLSPDGPEAHIVRTWRERLGDDRLDAEAWLGYSPDRLRKRWVSPGQLGAEERKLFEVPRGCEEFLRVAAAFHSAPREPPAYLLSPQATWDRVRIQSILRVENGLQDDGSAKPYFDMLRRSVEEQGLEFEPGIHTVWGYHGAEDSALESIVSNPVAGFAPLTSGSRNSTLWGSGTYFARDAKYVADGGFCGTPAADGTRKMLMCLLLTGVPCLGDPVHRGVLPFRHKPHRYHSSVDSLSNPEIYIIQHPGAAVPAYLITFA